MVGFQQHLEHHLTMRKIGLFISMGSWANSSLEGIRDSRFMEDLSLRHGQ
jgi:hypothetical protein